MNFILQLHMYELIKITSTQLISNVNCRFSHLDSCQLSLFSASFLRTCKVICFYTTCLATGQNNYCKFIKIHMYELKQWRLFSFSQTTTPKKKLWKEAESRIVLCRTIQPNLGANNRVNRQNIRCIRITIMAFQCSRFGFYQAAVQRSASTRLYSALNAFGRIRNGSITAIARDVFRILYF